MAILNLVGLILNLIGTVIVSFSAGSLFTRIHTALMAHQLTIESMLNRQQAEIPLFHGLEKGRAEEVKKADQKLVIGLVIIVVGFVLQAVAALVPLIKS